MESSDYYIFPEEKLAIKKILEEDRQKYLNFIIDNLESNLKLGNFEKNIWEYYTHAEEVLEYFSKLYLAIFKDELNCKHKLSKVYIPMSLKDFDTFSSNSEYLGLLIGTKDLFVAKTKDYDIKDLVIVEAELKNVPVYITKEEFDVLETVILAPPYSVQQSGEIEEIEGRTFVKFSFENITYSKKKNVPDNILEEIVGESFNQTENLKKYYQCEADNYEISISLARTKSELLSIQEKEIKQKEENTVVSESTIEQDKIRIAELAKNIELNIEKFNKNQEEMLIYLDSIREWKSKIHDYLEKLFADAIMEIELERTKIKKAENLTAGEKEFFLKLQKALKSNKDESELILKRSEELIKIEQKFAKIAADCGANYVAVSDGFRTREAALELFTLMDNIYKDFEEYYIALTSNGEKNAVKEIRYKKVLDDDNQIGILINYFNNAKSAKPGTSVDRFDELALIEENELKRQIAEYVFKTIAKSHIYIIEQEIEDLENKTSMEKVKIYLSGNKDVEEFRVCENEYKIEKIEKKLSKTFSIEKNYSIHEILAYIIMFKEENSRNEDEKIQKTIQKLTIVENTIESNFNVDIDKVAEIMLEKSYDKLPLNKKSRNMKELEKIEYVTDGFLKQYSYDTIEDTISKKYPDTVAKEIKKIIDYTKVTF